MCGIAGAVGRSSEDTVVERATEKLAHRGPDASGHRRFQDCILAHTRLRIIDLNPSADQPMTNEDGTVWVVFNGEVYNFTELRRELRSDGHRFLSLIHI